jgi:hypothetical protein
MKTIILTAIAVIFLSCTSSINTGTKEDMDLRNQEILLARTNNEEWSKHPLCIINKYFLYGLCFERLEVSFEKLNEGKEAVTFLKISFKDKHYDLENDETSWSKGVVYLKKTDDIWLFVDEP